MAKTKMDELANQPEDLDAAEQKNTKGGQNRRQTLAQAAAARAPTKAGLQAGAVAAGIAVTDSGTSVLDAAAFNQGPLKR